MKKPEAGQAEGLRFGATFEAIEAYHVRTAGKILLISDGEDLATIAPFSRSGRAVFVVLAEGDALPLFTMPDGVGGVVAAGGEEVMRAARFYAGLQKLTPLLLPSDAALDGVCEAHGLVKIDGEEADLPLAAGEAVCDLARMQKSLARGYARLLLTRLAAFEAKALSRFGRREDLALCERAVFAAENVQEGEEVVRANAKIRALEGEGLPRGEGFTLARRLPFGGELSAYRALFALYCAFFEYGRPRHICPDYRARAERAGVPYADLNIPAWEEYIARAAALERMRSACCAELCFIKKQEGARLRTLRKLGGTVPERISAEDIKILPELCPDGLTAVVRDFGLMEF